jgi:hypothetical protein
MAWHIYGIVHRSNKNWSEVKILFIFYLINQIYI